MLRKGIVCLLLTSLIIISGCSGDLQALKKENAELKLRLSNYENSKTQTESPVSSKPGVRFETPPVKLTSIEFDKSGVTGVNIKFQNNSPKTLDAIEFVILQFDNFGRPAYRFNDSKYGNISGELLLQGIAKQNGTLSGGWTLFNTEKTTKGKVVVKQVHYTDNSLWINQNFSEQINFEKEKL